MKRMGYQPLTTCILEVWQQKPGTPRIVTLWENHAGGKEQTARPIALFVDHRNGLVHPVVAGVRHTSASCSPRLIAFRVECLLLTGGPCRTLSSWGFNLRLWRSNSSRGCAGNSSPPGRYPQIHQTVSSRTPCRFGGGTLTSSMSSEVLEALVKGPGTEKQRSLEAENLKVPPRSPLETVKKHPSTPKSSARLTKKPKPGEEKSTSDPPQGVLPPGQVLH